MKEKGEGIMFILCKTIKINLTASHESQNCPPDDPAWPWHFSLDLSGTNPDRTVRYLRTWRHISRLPWPRPFSCRDEQSKHTRLRGRVSGEEEQTRDGKFVMQIGSDWNQKEQNPWLFKNQFQHILARQKVTNLPHLSPIWPNFGCKIWHPCNKHITRCQFGK